MYSRLFTILLFFFGIHLFLYYSAVRFFIVTDSHLKNALFIITSFLSVSFMISAILVRVHINLFTRAFYALSAFWSGLAIYLLIAATIAWLIAVVCWIAGRTPPMCLIGSLLFAAAFLYSAYGVWNAFHPRITNVEVGIPGLPERWQHKTIIQISDVHLGVIHTPRYFRGIIKTINSLHPDIIFITGDLFDSIGAENLSLFVEPLNELEAKNGIFYVNGNHENYIGMDTVMSVLDKTKIRVLRDEVTQIDGMQIVGVDYPEFGIKGDVKKTILSQKDFKKGMPSILLYHTPTSIDQNSTTAKEFQTRTYWNPDLDFTAARELGINLQLSGHTHRGQMIPFVYLAESLYRGYEYGFHREGDFSIYISSGLGTFGPHIRTGTESEIVLIRLKPQS